VECSVGGAAHAYLHAQFIVSCSCDIDINTVRGAYVGGDARAYLHAQFIVSCSCDINTGRGVYHYLYLYYYYYYYYCGQVPGR
jgi:hypothetical protein